MGGEYRDWVVLAENRENWWVVVRMVMNFGFHKVWGTAWLTEKLLASKKNSAPRSRSVVYCSNKQSIHTQPNVLLYYERQHQQHTVSTALSTVHCLSVQWKAAALYILLCVLSVPSATISSKQEVANWTIWNLSEWASILIRVTDFDHFSCWQ